MEDASAGTRLLHDLRSALSELSFDAASATPRRPGVSISCAASTRATTRPTEQSLATPVRFLVEMAVYMQDPHPDRFPQFEPAVCALAALAHRSGYRPSADFDEDYRLFLLPGLSD
jgi:hypothetical protein